MLQSVVSPMVAATHLKSLAENKSPTEKDFKGKGSESSFGKALEDKMSNQRQPRETKDSMRGNTSERSQAKEKPDKPEGPAKKSETEVVRAEEAPRKVTSRQQAIQEFMDSFESEFEISPTRLVEAMAQLKDSQLTQSPEDTAEAVIQQLDLPQEDQEKAQAMYAGLLTQLHQISVPAKAPMMGAAGTGAQGMQDRILASQNRQDLMLQSVDKLNQKFWSNPKVTGATPNPEALTGLNTPTQGLQNLQIADELMSPETPMMDPHQAGLPSKTNSLLDKLPPHLRGQMSETMSPALLAALAAKQAAHQGADEEGGEESSLTGEFQQAATLPKLEASGAMAGASVPLKNASSADQFSFSGEQQSGGMPQQNSAKSTVKAQTLTEGAEAGAVKKSEFQQSLTGLEGVHGAPIKGEVLRPEMGMPVAANAAPGAPMDPAENEAAVKQLMNQAQYLIKKGGGEMKVQMTPEGMGTIHLKVMLQDGKVNMQMSAETQEAKKTLESSLAELKTSLAAHKLSMENVKVDVVNSTSADTATQNQTNLNGQHQRDQQTRQFWNQFNENFGSQGRQESLLEMQSLRGYRGKRDSLQPIDTETKTASRKVEGKGSGLNLVA